MATFDIRKFILVSFPTLIILLVGIKITYVTGNEHFGFPPVVALVYVMNIIAILWFGLVSGAMIQEDVDKKHELKKKFDNPDKDCEVRVSDTKTTDDLLERPLYLLTEGKLVSYIHTPKSNPVIKEIVLQYNKKEYTFKISDISIKDK